jgi:hypothetical protein
MTNHAKKENDLLVTTVLEEKDIVLQLFRGIKSFVVFDHGKHVTPCVLTEEGSNHHMTGSQSVERFEVYNSITNRLIASLKRTSIIGNPYTDAFSIKWEAEIIGTGFGAQLVKMLEMKYPESKHSVDDIFERKFGDTVYDTYTIKELYGRNSYSDIILELYTVAEFSGCMVLMTDATAVKENGISTATTIHTVYLTVADNIPDIIQFESVSKAHINVENQITGIIEEYIVIRKIPDSGQQPLGRQNFIVGLFHYLHTRITGKNSLYWNDTEIDAKKT